jgi:hypothetical protein
MAVLGGAAVSGERKGAGQLEAARLSAPRTWREGRRRGGSESTPGSGGGWRGREVGRRLRVEDSPDRWAPPVSGVWEERGVSELVFR